MIYECLKLDMFLTRLSQADGVLCRWIFKRPAYPGLADTGNGDFPAGFAEENIEEEGFGYAS